MEQTFTPNEIVRRAYSLIGKQKGEYDLIFYNCEHFARWCKTGELKSRQVETGLKVVGGIVVTATAIVIGVNVAKVLEEKKIIRILNKSSGMYVLNLQMENNKVIRKIQTSPRVNTCPGVIVSYY